MRPACPVLEVICSRCKGWVSQEGLLHVCCLPSDLMLEVMQFRVSEMHWSDTQAKHSFPSAGALHDSDAPLLLALSAAAPE